MSKLNQAIEIVKANSDKKAALSAIQETLKVTRANASVYLFKAMKAIGTPVADTPKVEKQVKAPVEVKASTRTFTEEDNIEYENAMAEREASGFSSMSIDEYFDMKSNLAALA